MPSPSRWIRPLKRSTMPFVRGVEGRVLRWVTPSFWHAASKPSAVKQEPRSVSTWVTWKGPDRFLEESHGAALGLIVLDRQVDEAGGAVDGHIEVPLAALAISCAQLGQELHVHMHEAKIVVLEGPVRLAGAACRRQTAQALGFQDTVDRVPI